MRTVQLRLRSEFQIDAPHEDARPTRQGRLPLPLLRYAFLGAVDTGEAHAQVRRPAAKEGAPGGWPPQPDRRRPALAARSRLSRRIRRFARRRLLGLQRSFVKRDKGEGARQQQRCNARAIFRCFLIPIERRGRPASIQP